MPTEYYFVFGIYRNVIFGILAGGMENLVSEEHVIEHATLLLDKIKTFPLTAEVSYSPE